MSIEYGAKMSSVRNCAGAIRNIALASVLTALCLAGVALPVAAQSSPEARLERLRAERLQAAEAALAQAEMAAGPAMPAGDLPEEEAKAPSRIVPPWQARLSPEARRLFEDTFEAEGVPAELLAVGWVESRFQDQALSAKGARGVWQLMPATARRYGLAVSPERDDRTRLGPATRAAARYLAELHAQFGDWALALAAYNAGPAQVEAALARAGSRDFWRARPWLPAETQAYVPAVLAAMGAAPTALDDGGAVRKLPSRGVGQLLFATTALPASGEEAEEAVDTRR